MKTLPLHEMANYVTEKIAISDFDNSFYISTDSMVKDKGGLIEPESIPSEGKVTKYQENDILVSNIRPYFKKIWYSNRIGGCSNDVIVFRAKKKYNSRFLYYALSDDSFFEYVMSGANGTKMPRGNKKLIPNFEIPDYDSTTQQRIAEILSRYDELIENYQKQIKLLEEAAQRLYKEWFVDLRFPGYENVEVVDGVPEGWEKKSVDSIYSFKYGKNLSTRLITTVGKYPVYGANGVIGFYDKANCQEQVVLITSRGNGSGDVLMTYHNKAFVTNNSFIVKPLEGFEYCELPFTFQFLKVANFRSVRTGAAQPQLTNQSIHTVDVVLPSKEAIQRYCKIVSKNNNQITTLKTQIRHLTEARDRLLPKLMSGEIEV